MVVVPMRHTLHLLAIDRHRDEALVSWLGSRWLLPMLSCDERVRAGPFVKRWAACRGILGEPIGQWLGRMGSESSIDWLVVMAADRSANVQPPLAWAPCDGLASQPALVDYQAWALARTRVGGSHVHVPGPFGTLEWFDDVLAWVMAVTGSDRSGPITGYRLSSHEVVFGLDTHRGRFYFKGLAGERCREPRITAAMAKVAPDSFAATVASERRGDAEWWLTAACEGRPIHGEQLDLAATALARLQQQTMSAAAALRELPTFDLRGVLEWVGELPVSFEVATTLRRCVEEVAAADVPHTWIPMDLDPGNVLLNAGGGVRFIDLDDSFIGSAPLAMAVLARRCGIGDGLQSYLDAWRPPIERVPWRAFENASALMEAWLGWQRLELNIRRGEMAGALERATASLAARLTRVVQRR